MEIRHLRAICAIAEAGSLSRAAARLGLTQPSLSVLLQRFERAVGGELFVRSRMGAELTPLGELVVRRARIVLGELDALVGDLSWPNPPGQKSFRIGASDMMFVSTVFARIRESMPGVVVTLQIEPSAVALAHSLSHNRVDIALIAIDDGHDLTFSPTVDHRVLLPRVPTFVAVAATHPVASQQAIELAALAGEAWICPPGGDDGSLTALRQACRDSGFEPQVVYEIPSGSGAPFIASGQAIRLVEPTRPEVDGVVIRPLVGDPLRSHVVMAWRRTRVRAEDVHRFCLESARAYQEHATRQPVYATWWAEHPEAHPFLG